MDNRTACAAARESRATVCTVFSSVAEVCDGSEWPCISSMDNGDGRIEVLRTAVETRFFAKVVSFSPLAATAASCLKAAVLDSLEHWIPHLNAALSVLNFVRVRRTLTVDGQMLCMCLALHCFFLFNSCQIFKMYFDNTPDQSTNSCTQVGVFRVEKDGEH